MTPGKTYNADFYFIFLSGIFLAALAVAVFTSLYWLAAIPFACLVFYFGWQQQQVIFYLLIFFLPWSFEYSLNSSLGTDLPDEPLMLLTATLFVARFLFKPYDVSGSWNHPLIILLFFYFAWIVVTVPFSTDWLVSLKFLLAKTWYLLAFVFAPMMILRSKKAIRSTTSIFLLSILSVVIIIICRHAVNGFRFAKINEAVSPFFRNHVNYSAMVVCSIPLLIAVYRLNKKLRVVTVAAVIIVLVGVLFSYARGAWLALLVGLASYWLIRNQKLVIAFASALVLLIAFAFWISKKDRYLSYSNDYRTTIFHTNFKEHLIATYKLKDISTAERLNRWVAGVRMVKDNWLTGYGPNTFYNNYKAYALPAFRTWVSDNKEHSTVHNYFLLVLIEQGIPGLLFILLLVGVMLYYAEALYQRTDDVFYKTAAMACGLMLMMILTVNFLSDLVETDKVGSLFFLCLAMLVVIDVNTNRAVVEN